MEAGSGVAIAVGDGVFVTVGAGVGVGAGSEPPVDCVGSVVGDIGLESGMGVA